jgi:hypothetical protein
MRRSYYHIEQYYHRSNVEQWDCGSRNHWYVWRCNRIICRHIDNFLYHILWLQGYRYSYGQSRSFGHNRHSYRLPGSNSYTCRRFIGRHMDKQLNHYCDNWQCLRYRRWGHCGYSYYELCTYSYRLLCNRHCHRKSTPCSHYRSIDSMYGIGYFFK